jgi:hypothetical protein
MLYGSIRGPNFAAQRATRIARAAGLNHQAVSQEPVLLATGEWLQSASTCLGGVVEQVGGEQEGMELDDD